MFLPVKEQFVNKTFRINTKLLAELFAYARRQGISLNALVVQCCRYALDESATP